jgi:hypothetical protein
MLFHTSERLLHFGEEPTRNGDHMGVTPPSSFGRSAIRKLLVEDVLFADLD